MRRATVLLAAILSLASQVAAPATVAARTTAPAGAPTLADRAALATADASSHLSAEVVGYLPYWEMEAPTFADIDLTKLTSIVLFSIGWDANGHIVTDAPGYRGIVSSATGTFIAAAKAAGVRVLVSFTSFNLDKNTAFFANPSATSTFVAEAAAFVAALGLDGADLDVELLSTGSFPAYAQTAGALRAQLRITNPGALVTVATNGNTSGAKMAALALAAGADRAFLMGYSYRTAGSAPGAVDPMARVSGGLSLTASLDLYAQNAVPLNHVLLGLPLYGRSWPTIDATLGSPRRTDVKTNDGDAFVYQNLATLRATGTWLAEDYIPVEEASRLVRMVDGVTWQSFYNSQANLETKMRLVLQRGLAGAGLWALGYSTGAPEYWTAIGNVFGAPIITGLTVTPSPTNSRTVTLGIAWRNVANVATEMRIATGTTPLGAWQPLAPVTSWTLPTTGPSVKLRTIKVQLRDGAGAESLVATTTVLYDAAPPTLTKLTVTWSSTSRAWIVRYAGKDVGSGIAFYRIVLRRNGVNTVVAAQRTKTQYVLKLPHSAHFRIAVRAYDRAGGQSATLYVRR